MNDVETIDKIASEAIEAIETIRDAYIEIAQEKDTKQCEP